MSERLFAFALVGIVVLVGCGKSTGTPGAPSGNELQQYLAENPDIANATEPESNPASE